MSLHRKHKKSDTSFWDEHRGTIRTRKGGWVIGEAVHNQGYSMMDDLVGRVSFFQVLFLNATGRMPERRLADWLEALFICLSWPDARIWCNQISSLAGTLKTTPVAGVSAAILASDSRMYGPGVVLAGSEFIAASLREFKRGISAEHIVVTYPQRRADGTPVIPGFVRPIASGDERVEAMEKVTADFHLSGGDHLDLAYAIEGIMIDRYNEGMNLLGYAVAFLNDQGLTSTEIYCILSTWVHAGAHACFAEAVQRPPESFFPLHCSDIDYQGKEARPVPKANHQK